MRLEMGTFPVHTITFGSQTRYQEGHLEVDKAAVLEAVLHDPRIATADLERNNRRLSPLHECFTSNRRAAG